MRKLIQITGHEVKEFETWKKHVVFEDRTKYEFGETKQDGSPTKAWTQWQEQGLSVGASAETEFDETPEEYPVKINV